MTTVALPLRIELKRYVLRQLDKRFPQGFTFAGKLHVEPDVENSDNITAHFLAHPRVVKRLPAPIVVPLDDNNHSVQVRFGWLVE